MAYISKITLPSGTTYDIKDAEARSQISALVGGDAVVFMGVSSTPLTDGGNERPTIDGSPVTPAAGQLFFYDTQEYIYGPDSEWHALGSLDSLGALAYKDSASGKVTPTGTVSTPTFTGTSSDVTVTVANNNSGNYQPAGTVSQPTFSGTAATISSSATYTPGGNISLSNSNTTTTVSKASSGTATYTPEGSVAAPTISVKTAGSTTTIKNPTKVTVAKTVVAAAPGATAPNNNITYYSVSDETLSLYQLGYTTGDSITTTNVTVKDGDAAYEASAPTFTGTGARLVTGNISVPSSATFTGTEATISSSASYTPAGNVSQPTFSGTKVKISGTTTASGNISQPTFTGDEKTVTVS